MKHNDDFLNKSANRAIRIVNAAPTELVIEQQKRINQELRRLLADRFNLLYTTVFRDIDKRLLSLNNHLVGIVLHFITENPAMGLTFGNNAKFSRKEERKTMSLYELVLTVTGSALYASFFEWVLHRFVMHRPFFGFAYPYKAHALTHHRIFKADDSYHLKEDSDKWTIPMAWWNGPVLVLFAATPFLFIGWQSWLIALAVLGLYYGAYERLHWCMHLPRNRRVEKSWFFFRLNGHHLLHHRYPNRNFNVALPAADLLLGTLLPRSRFRFVQARGPTVPDVQPRGDKRAVMV